jgi:cyanophycin synthetase
MKKDKDLHNIHLRLYVEAAEKLGIKSKILFPNRVIKFYKDRKSWMIYNSSLPINNSASVKIAESKYVTSHILTKAGIPIPKNYKFTDIDEAIKFFRSKTLDQIVIKPAQGLGGKGITIKPKTEDEFIKAYKEAQKYCKEILVEKFIIGKNYRILVLGNKVIAVAERTPPYIIGDGIHSIKYLVTQMNLTRISTLFNEVPFDNELIQTIRSQNYILSSVLKHQEKIYIRRNCNMSTGGLTIDRTDEIHPENAKLAIKATKIIGLKFAGVDIITSNISKSMIHSSGVINEINNNPGLRIHHFPIEGKSRNVAHSIMKYLYKNL